MRALAGLGLALLLVCGACTAAQAPPSHSGAWAHGLYSSLEDLPQQPGKPAQAFVHELRIESGGNASYTRVSCRASDELKLSWSAPRDKLVRIEASGGGAFRADSVPYLAWELSPGPTGEVQVFALRPGGERDQLDDFATERWCLVCDDPSEAARHCE